MNIRYNYFPKNKKINADLSEVIDIFQRNENAITSPENKLESNEVLHVILNDLVDAGFQVERSKKKCDSIQVPVLFGENGKFEKCFLVDAYSVEKKIVIEVEAGRGYTNYQFLKDIFQASVMVDVDYLVIAVRKLYRNNEDYKKIVNFMETLYASDRLVLPLKGILIVGY